MADLESQDQKYDLFKEVLPSIMETKKFLDDIEPSYNSFMVNRALSLYPDCLFMVNDMNRLHFLPKSIQYVYYMGIIRARKRQFQPWPKKGGSAELKAVMWYFDYSEQKADVALSILDESEITRIVQVYKDTH